MSPITANALSLMLLSGDAQWMEELKGQMLYKGGSTAPVP